MSIDYPLGLDGPEKLVVPLYGSILVTETLKDIIESYLSTAVAGPEFLSSAKDPRRVSLFSLFFKAVLVFFCLHFAKKRA